MLSKDIIDCVVNYLIGDRSIYNSQSELFKNLFVAYLSDKNSSTLREAATLEICKCEKLDFKHGADGKDPVTGKLVEVKPTYAHKDKKGKQNLLGGGGTFNDIHFEKVQSCLDWDIVCSGFAEDKLIYIIRFPFSYLAPRLNEFIQNKIESNKKKTEGQTQGRFSTVFSFKHYIDCPELQIVYFNEEHAPHFLHAKIYETLSQKYDRKLFK